MTMADFQFKQFGIRQDRCAMKVGTDGVLLGAWAEGGARILDIGTGTGLVALMMAQRFPEARVVGIDLDAGACAQAGENVAGSPFAGRVDVVHCALQEYDGGSAFDAIVSNPPFFVDSLKNPDGKRAMARHADSLPFRDLFRGVDRLLSADGVFSAIVPAEVLERFVAESCVSGFFLVRKCGVKTVARKAPKRYLLSFARHRAGVADERVEIMTDSAGNRSPWYAEITEEFYL